MKVANASVEASSDDVCALAGAEGQLDVLLHGDFVGFAFEGAGADDF